MRGARFESQNHGPVLAGGPALRTIYGSVHRAHWRPLSASTSTQSFLGPVSLGPKQLFFACFVHANRWSTDLDELVNALHEPPGKIFSTGGHYPPPTPWRYLWF